MLDEYKIVLLGDFKVGKTSILNRLIHQSYSDALETTPGTNVLIKELDYKGKTYTLRLLDTIGNYSFMNLKIKIIKNLNAALIVFDLTNRNTFENTEK